MLPMIRARGVSSFLPQLCLGLGILVSVLLQMWRTWHSSAFEWPAIDLAPALIRILDGDLQGDFTADAMVATNGRTPFILLVAGLARCGGGDWLTGLTIVKAVVVAMPALIFWLLWHISGRLRAGGWWMVPGWCVAVAIAGGSGWPGVMDWTVINSWRPMPLDATPFSASLVLALGAVVAAIYGRRYLAIGSLSFASLLHPLPGLMVGAGMAWWCLLASRTRGEAWWWGVMPLVMGGLMGALGATHGSVDAMMASAVNITLRHPHHYEVAHFDPLRSWPWMVPFGLLIGSFTVAMAICLWHRQVREAKWLGGVLVGVLLIIPIHWALAERWPWLPMVQMGLPRIFSVAYLGHALAWMLAIRALAMRSGTVHSDMEASTDSGRSMRLGLVVLLGLIMIMGFMGLRDARPTLMRGSSYAQFLRSLPAGTPVLVADGPLALGTHLVIRQPLWVSSAFPFRADRWEEYGRRFRVLKQLGTGEISNELRSVLWQHCPLGWVVVRPDRPGLATVLTAGSRGEDLLTLRYDDGSDSALETGNYRP